MKMEADSENNLFLSMRSVFELMLVSNKTFKDDTFFKKLTDLANQTVTSPSSFEKSGCEAVLRSATQCPSEESVVTFLLDLVGVVIKVPEIAICYTDLFADFLGFTSGLVDTDTPSVGSSFFNTLHNVVTCEDQNKVDVMRKCQGLLSKCWSIMKAGKSVFYTNAVITFLQKFLLRKKYHSEKEFSDFVQNVEDHLNHEASVLTSQKTNHSGPLTKCCLRIVPYMDCTATLSPASLQQLIENLAFLVCETQVWDNALDVLLSFKQSIPSCRDVLLALPKKISKTDLLRSQKVCVKLLQSRDSLNEDQCLQLVKCPLLVIRDIGEDNSVGLARNQMQNKNNCISLLWNTLESLISLKILSDDVMDDVVAVFAATVEEDHKNGISRNILGCRKIQLKCCEVFLQNKCNQETMFKATVGNLVLKLISSRKIDNTLYSKCMKVLCESLSSLLQNEPQTEIELTVESYNQVLTNCVQQRLCDLEWEIRDTTLEFCKNIVEKYSNNTEVVSWMSHCCLCSHVMAATEDKNSYVRASALDCLASVLTHLISHIKVDEVLQRVLSIIRKDSEAFPRRAAMGVLVNCWTTLEETCSEEEVTSIYSVLNDCAAADFDWEVKLRTVEFWNGVFVKQQSVTCLPSYALQQGVHQQSTRNIMKETLHENGCLTSLLKLIEDYDQSVCKAACTLLIKIKENISLQRDLDSSEPRIKKVKASMEEQTDSILKTYQLIYSIDLDKKLDVFSTTCDEYDRNPMSLLEDIMADLQAKEHPEEDNAIDCY